MCGWVGKFGAVVDPEELERAAEAIASRGPDARGIRSVGPADLKSPWPYGLAHQRLSIIDLSESGAQPMTDPDHGVSLVYNGELYNSPELRDALQKKGHRFRGLSDTEVLLRGYIEWGDEVLGHIEGIFSFALVDERKGRALLARDRSGIKPLYWGEVNGQLVAGSAPRALMALSPELGDEIDRIAMAQFLTLLWIPHPRSPWAAIHKLPPGNLLVFDGTQTVQKAYWSPPAAATVEQLDPGELLRVLRSATRRQLLSDVPVGLLFSGGLDSTVLLALMADCYGVGELDAYTAGYDRESQKLEIAPDDAAYARSVTDHITQTALHEVEIDLDAERDLDVLAKHFDDPVADPAAITLYRLCQASQHKVLLSGVGGEELWAGYPRHQALSTARRVASLPTAARRSLEAISPILHGARPGPAYGPRRNVQKLCRALGDQRRPHYWRMMAQLTYAEMDQLIPGTASDAYDELDAQCPALERATLTDALAFDRAQFLPNLNLAYVDKASMATSVEVRVPLLDEAVLNLTHRADVGGFIVDNVTKVPLRRASRGVVPDAIIDRPKSGFGGPARAWFQGRTGARLGERIDALCATGLVERGAARKIYRDAASGRRDAALSAWALVCLQAWQDTHRRGSI